MSHLKFKMLADGYPLFRFPENLLEEVDLSDFYKAEKERLPLFIGTQFGLYPSGFPLRSFEGKEIAILEKSQLSGRQFSILIYEIREGQRIEIQRIPLEMPFWDSKNLKEYNNESPEGPKIRIPEFNIYGIWYNLEEIGINSKSRFLIDTYHEVISKGYKDFLNYAFQNENKDWLDFLRSEPAQPYVDLFRALYRCCWILFPNQKDLPLPLEKELRMFRNIRNPYRKRSREYSELPEPEDILLLSDPGLCIYYNNFININSFEAEVVQKEILKELKLRDFYIKNEHLLMNHANPIEIKVIYHTPIVTINDKVGYRRKKDIALWEKGPSNPQIIYERYYGLYNKLTNVQLVDQLNNQIGLSYWGLGRAAVIKAMEDQLKIRDIDISSISDQQSFSLKYCVILENKRIVRIGELSKDHLKPILEGYLLECYPTHDLVKIKILKYDLEKLKFQNLNCNTIFETPINDLLKREGEMKAIGRPRM